MPKRSKPFTLPQARVASRLAARAEELLKANRDIGGDVYDRLDALVREASYQQAGSKEAALFHLGILGANAELLTMGIPDREIDRLHAMNKRLVESLATYIEAITGVDRERCGMRFYLGTKSSRPLS